MNTRFEPLARRQTLAQEIGHVLRERTKSGALQATGCQRSGGWRSPSGQPDRHPRGRLQPEPRGPHRHPAGAGAFVADDIPTTLRIDTSRLEHEQALLYISVARFAIEPLAAERRQERDLVAMRGALDGVRDASRQPPGAARRTPTSTARSWRSPAIPNSSA